MSMRCSSSSTAAQGSRSSGEALIFRRPRTVEPSRTILWRGFLELPRILCLFPFLAWILIGCSVIPEIHRVYVISTPRATLALSPSPRGPIFPYPAALLSFNEANGALDLLSEAGQSLAELGTISWADPDLLRGAPVGLLGGDPQSVRFAYLSDSEKGLGLFVRSAVGPVRLGEFPAGSLLAGSERARYIAVSAPRSSGASGQTEGTMFLIDPIRRTGLDDPMADGLDVGIIPLRVQVEQDQPTGIVYCVGHAEERSGGDQKCAGLFRIGIPSLEIEEIIPKDLDILALSPDLRFVALVSTDRIPPEVRVRSLETGIELVFRSEPGVREVRAGTISPSGKRIAWANESEGPGGESVPGISLASTAGGPVTELASASFTEAVGAQMSKVTPVGWLDEERLLLEMITPGGPALYLLRMQEGRLDRLASGRFAGFVYQ